MDTTTVASLPSEAFKRQTINSYFLPSTTTAPRAMLILEYQHVEGLKNIVG